MRGKVPAGVTLALALLIPAAPAVAETGALRPETASCQEVMVYTDIRALVTIDLDTASNDDIQVLAARILNAANANSLTGLSGAVKKHLAGTPDELRAFLKTTLQKPWSTDLRIAISRTLTNAGPHVQTAAREALNNGTIDAYLTYLNHGLYIARALDCSL